MGWRDLLIVCVCFLGGADGVVRHVVCVFSFWCSWLAGCFAVFWKKDPEQRQRIIDAAEQLKRDIIAKVSKKTREVRQLQSVFLLDYVTDTSDTRFYKSAPRPCDV